MVADPSVKGGGETGLLKLTEIHRTIVVLSLPFLRWSEGEQHVTGATSVQSGRRISPLLQFRFWQFGLLVALTAIAIVDIQGYCREPKLIALASAGYAGYALLCWLLWHAIRRFESRLGSVLVVAIYAVAMGELFLAATVAYLVIEYFYLGGKLH